MNSRISEIIVLDDESDDELHVVDSRSSLYSRQNAVAQISKPSPTSLNSSPQRTSKNCRVNRGPLSNSTCQAQQERLLDVSEYGFCQRTWGVSDEHASSICYSHSIGNTDNAGAATDTRSPLSPASCAHFEPNTESLFKAREKFSVGISIERNRMNQCITDCHGLAILPKSLVKTAMIMDLTQEDDRTETDDFCFENQPANAPNETPVTLDDDEDDDLIILDDDEIMYEGALAVEQLHRPTRRSSRTRSTLPRRNPHLALPWEPVTSCKASNGQTITRDKTFEVKDRNFLIVAEIYLNNSTGDYKIRGHSLQRTKDMNGMFNADYNELCWKVEVELDDARPVLKQSMIEINLRDILHCRTLRVTNQEFPEGRDPSFSRSHISDAETSRVLRHGILVVRWKFTQIYRDIRSRIENKTVGCAITRVEHADITGLRPTWLMVDKTVLRAAWRGKTILHGSHKVQHQKDALDSLNTYQDSTKQCRSPSVIELDPPGPVVETQKNCRNLQTCVIDLTDNKGEGDGIRPSLTSCSIQSQLYVLSLEKKVMLVGNGVQRSTHEDCLARECLHMRESQSQLERCVHASCTNTDLSVPKPRGCSVVLSERSSPPTLPSTSSSSLSSSSLSSSLSFNVNTSKRQYTFGDAFCGAGGSSRGACQAGLRLLWGLDRCNQAAQTWVHNFPNAKLFHQAAHEFITCVERPNGSPEHKVDVLHLSPPCQYFSPAHTVIGKDDDQNQAALFACGPLIDMARPRLVTLEQTFGITHHAHRYFLHHIINTFVIRGFSFRWSTIPLQYYGLPQRRLRLIFIAACPGETLPDFPPYTHNEYGSDGKSPFNSVSRTLRSIPTGAANHNLRGAKPRDRRPWNADGIVPRCITTHGGHNYHHSGRRDLTHREFAALQTFVHEHVFYGSFVKRQIGNAVPPMIAEILFRHLINALTEADDIEINEKADRSQQDVVMLD